MVGKTLEELDCLDVKTPNYIAVKEAVYPFIKFPGTDTLLGPEMKSTGEVMGIAYDFGTAFAKSQISAYNRLPKSGQVFISLMDEDKPRSIDLAGKLIGLGFEILSTSGTAKVLEEAGLKVKRVKKVAEGRPNIVDAIVNNEVALVINTTRGTRAVADSYDIRRSTLEKGLPYYTTIQEALAAMEGLDAGEPANFEVHALQDYYKGNLE
jgi:carbamoyl-phosphate synthase large subunit